jgi:hypothetical protein
MKHVVASLGVFALSVACATFGAGCAGDESTEEVDSVELAQDEIVISVDMVATDAVPDGTDGADEEGDLTPPSSGRETESEQGSPGPQDLCAEPVPHPWVPKVHKTDNDT